MFLSMADFYLKKVKEFALKEVLKLDKNEVDFAKSAIIEGNNIVKKATDNYTLLINRIADNK